MASNIIPRNFYSAVAVPVTDENGNSAMVQWSRASTGTKQVVVLLEITEGEYKGRRSSWFGSFTKNSVVRTLESLRYLGWIGDDVMRLGDLDQEVTIDLDVEAYEDTEGNPKERNKVNWINRPGGGGVKVKDPLNDQEILQLAAQLKSYAARIPSVPGTRLRGPKSAPAGGTPLAGGTSRSSAPQESARQQNEDEIPF